MARKFLSPLNLLNLTSDPGTAAEGDLYWNSSTNKLRIYFDGAWADASDSIQYSYSSTAPSSPNAGDIWVDASDGTEYTYISDGDSSQWVELGFSGISFGGSSAGLPVGGTTGQVLAKIDSTNYNTQWVAQSGGGSGLTAIPLISTRYYSALYTTLQNNTIVANQTRFLPFYVFSTNSFDRIGIFTASNFSGTSTIRLGIYNDNAGQPGTVLLDAGTVNATSNTNAYTIAITTTTLNTGWYWLAANTTSAATTNSFSTVTVGAYGGFVGVNAPTSSTGGNQGYAETVNASSGFSTASTLTLTTAPYAIWLRKS